MSCDVQKLNSCLAIEKDKPFFSKSMRRLRKWPGIAGKEINTDARVSQKTSNSP